MERMESIMKIVDTTDVKIITDIIIKDYFSKTKDKSVKENPITHLKNCGPIKTFLDESFFTFSGGIEENKITGNGLLYFKLNGMIGKYDGNWKDNKMHGWGEYTDFTAGQIYIGNFFQGKRFGCGYLMSTNGWKYKGNWINDKINGLGNFYFDGEHICDEGIYKGNWMNNEKNGMGEMKYSNGDIYKGNWMFNERNGMGEMKYSNGDIYKGNWFANKMNGKGRIEFNDGSIYDGNFSNDKAEGSGMLISAQSVYEGTFINGERSGMAKVIYNNGNIYNGQYYLNQKNGFGILIYANGDRFEGEWVCGKPYGKGKYITAFNDETLEGIWINGVYIFDKNVSLDDLKPANLQHLEEKEFKQSFSCFFHHDDKIFDI